LGIHPDVALKILYFLKPIDFNSNVPGLVATGVAGALRIRAGVAMVRDGAWNWLLTLSGWKMGELVSTSTASGAGLATNWKTGSQ
jgi:hypothetical protein